MVTRIRCSYVAPGQTIMAHTAEATVSANSQTYRFNPYLSHFNQMDLKVERHMGVTSSCDRNICATLCAGHLTLFEVCILSLTYQAPLHNYSGWNQSG